MFTDIPYYAVELNLLVAAEFPPAEAYRTAMAAEDCSTWPSSTISSLDMLPNDAHDSHRTVQFLEHRSLKSHGASTIDWT